MNGSPEPLTIAFAAIKTQDGVVATLPRPARHHDIIHSLDWRGKANATSGFVTSEGNFVDRKEALSIAVNAGQLLKPTKFDQLYTEDVW